jgi:hypothetical protein
VAGLPRFLFREFDFAQLLGAFCEFWTVIVLRASMLLFAWFVHRLPFLRPDLSARSADKSGLSPNEISRLKYHISN